MLDENCLHFIYGETLYAVHKTTGKAYVTHFQRALTKSKVTYVPLEYDGLPAVVKRCLIEYRERTRSEDEDAGWSAVDSERATRHLV